MEAGNEDFSCRAGGVAREAYDFTGHRAVDGSDDIANENVKLSALAEGGTGEGGAADSAR